MTGELRALVEAELWQPVDQRVEAMAQAIADRHGSASRAVLFYGSCLRESRLDGLMLDFYLIVSDYAAAYEKASLARANALIPPNVFPFQHEGLAAKYAVLSEADFRRECGREATNVSTVARFSQPTRLVYAASEAAARNTIDSIAQAAPALIAWTIPISGPDPKSPEELWKLAFAQTFGAELRAERSDRSARIVDADPSRYYQFGIRAMQAIAEEEGVGPNGEVPLWKSHDAAVRWWRTMQRKGKLLSVLRLAKASATYAGGAEYIAWKINRHAGTKIELKPWQKRHPLLAAISLLPRLLRSGAIR